MEAGIHELTAGYALDALDPAERDAFEQHLGSCEQCQEELASFWEVTSALAVAADGPAPSAALRERIVDERAGGEADGRAARLAAPGLARARGGDRDRGRRRDRPRHLLDLAQREARRLALGADRAGERDRRARRPRRDARLRSSPAPAGSSSIRAARQCSSSTISPLHLRERRTRRGWWKEGSPRFGRHVRHDRQAGNRAAPHARAGRCGDRRSRSRAQAARARRRSRWWRRPLRSEPRALRRASFDNSPERDLPSNRSFRFGPYTCSRDGTAPRASEALRLRRLPARAGGGRRGSGRGPRHARADADGLGQVAHLSARGDAAARADARPLAADRADEGSGRPAAGGDRRHRDVRQLVARARRWRPQRIEDVADGTHAASLRRAGAAAQCVVRRDAPFDRRRASS